MKIYYPQIKNQIKIKLIDKNNDKLFQPFPGLDFFYLKLDPFTNLHIPSNTQLSEFLNKFNESDILPKLGEKMAEDLRIERAKLPDLQLMQKDFGWNWVNWNSKKGIKVLKNLELIQNKDKRVFDYLDRGTKEILGRIKLKISTDYGKEIEEKFNNYLEIDDGNFNDFPIEVNDIYDLLVQNNLVVIDYKAKFVHPDGIFWGEIDYILMNKITKKIHLADLKTSYSANNYDYWRQLSMYHNVFLKLNPHLKNNISDEIFIIHVSKLNNRNSKKLYSKKVTEDNLNIFTNQAIELKNNYINKLKDWNKKKIF